jgi:hypothetical protein
MRGNLVIYEAEMPLMKQLKLYLILLCIAGSEASMARNPESASDQARTAIEQAFAAGNPDALSPFLSDDEKIFVSMPIVDIPAGNYSKQQFLTALKQAFEKSATREFHLEDGQLLDRDRSPIRAVWRFSRRNSSKIINSSLYFTIDSASPKHKPVIKAIRGESSRQN